MGHRCRPLWAGHPWWAACRCHRAGPKPPRRSKRSPRCCPLIWPRPRGVTGQRERHLRNQGLSSLAGRASGRVGELLRRRPVPPRASLGGVRRGRSRRGHDHRDTGPRGLGEHESADCHDNRNQASTGRPSVHDQARGIETCFMQRFRRRDADWGGMYSGRRMGHCAPPRRPGTGWPPRSRSTVSAYSSTVDSLIGGSWGGPTSVAMLAAVTPYLSWMQATAGATAGEAAAQATAAATAYGTAFAAHVPPREIAANRSPTGALVATNIFGQNTPAIASTEIQYAEMWVQDAVAMDSYAGSSAAATKLTPFTAAPQTTNAGGLAEPGRRGGPSRRHVGRQRASRPCRSLSALPNPGCRGCCRWARDLSTDYTDILERACSTPDRSGKPGASALYGSRARRRQGRPSAITTGVQRHRAADQPSRVAVPRSSPLTPRLGAIPRDGLGAGLGAGPHWGRGTLFGSVTPEAHFGRGTLVGELAGARRAGPRRPRPSGPSPPRPHGRRTRRGAGGGAGRGRGLPRLGVAGGHARQPPTGAGAPRRGESRAVRQAALRTPLKDLKDSTSPEEVEASGRTDFGETRKRATPSCRSRGPGQPARSNWRRNPASTRCTCPKATSPQSCRRMRSWADGRLVQSKESGKRQL